MSTTKVQCECLSIKEEKSYSGKSQKQFVFGLEPTTNVEEDYFKLSSGTNFELRTINPEVAKMFEVGKNYDILISPAETKE